MKDQKEVVYGGPKYKSQLKIFERMIVVFDKAIKERELLLNNQISHENKEKIIGIDLRISMCIKKRARLTLGGYSYLPEKMYDWEPYYEIDRKLLPKTAS
tara:strand:+ start:159 stop:458 length:300 start_codon:yes stop_codon:yes gene_type:complete